MVKHCATCRFFSGEGPCKFAQGRLPKVSPGEEKLGPCAHGWEPITASAPFVVDSPEEDDE